jgi:hypothetical protein
MNWQSVLEPDIQEFIRLHENADLASLALKKPPHSSWAYPLILDQIKARQKARRKIPEWFEGPGPLLFPASSVIEQASSAATALYKASLFTGENFIDCTAGLGVDSWAMAKRFKSGTSIELDPQTAAALRHNLDALGCKTIEVVEGRAEDYIQKMPKTDLALIDPQRRDAQRGGKFKPESCSPNINDLLPHLLKQARLIVLKAAPMLDITATLANLGPISAVHIVEYDGDCKEVLYVFQQKSPHAPQITAVSLDQTGATLHQIHFTARDEQAITIQYAAPLRYLYEPSPAFQKAGCFGTLCQNFELYKLHPHTHLLTSQAHKDNFPGRIFEIHGLYPVRAKGLPMKQANITLRNFPGSAEHLRQSLKLKDGGEDTLFACTLLNEQKTLIHARKP